MEDVQGVIRGGLIYPFGPKNAHVKYLLGLEESLRLGVKIHEVLDAR